MNKAPMRLTEDERQDKEIICQKDWNHSCNTEMPTIDKHLCNSIVNYYEKPLYYISSPNIKSKRAL